MGEGEGGFPYTDETNPQRALDELNVWPVDYWEKHSDISRNRVTRLAEAFSKGASMPHKFRLRTGCLEVLPASADLQALDVAQTQVIDTQNGIHKQVADLVVQGNKAEVERIVDTNLAILASQFKVHLQPKTEDTESCVTELAKFVSGKDAHGLVYTFKMYAGWDWNEKRPDSMGNAQPDIIIYPYDGREKAQELVRKMDAHFKPHKQFGSGKVPGYNLKLSNLVFLAQSDRGFKRDLARVQLLDKYFDKGTNYGLLKGERAKWQGIIPSATPLHAVTGWLRRN